MLYLLTFHTNMTDIERGFMVTTEQFWFTDLTRGQSETCSTKVVVRDLVKVSTYTWRTISDEDNGKDVTLDVKSTWITDNSVTGAP